MNSELIVSLSFCFHDSCLSIASKDEILLHLEAERVFRKKHMRLESKDEMDRLLQIGLNYLGADINDVNQVLVSKWNNKYSPNDDILGKKFDFQYTNHHDNHIGTAFPSGFDDALIVCADGGSEDGTTKLYYKKGDKITFLEDLNDTPMTGKFYGTIAQMVIHPKCSRAHNTDVGKLMGLSAYGEPSKKYLKLISENWQEINKLHFNGCEHLLQIFGLNGDYACPWKDSNRVALAATAHHFWVDSFCDYLKKYKELSKNIAMVGGCALNICLNSALKDRGIFEKVYSSPISTDCGQSLGAILFKYPHIKCKYPFLGRGFGTCSKVDYEVLIKDLLEEKIIAWYQDRSEIGPRALGHRSFLGIPNSQKMKHKLSVEVKNREEYRPVATIIPSEEKNSWFIGDYNSPYMTQNYLVKDITKKLAPAIVHKDGTCRAQTLKKADNPILYELLMQLKRYNQPPMLMNSSFNVAGEPIVDTPEDAKRCFLNSNADVLYLNGQRIERND